MSVRRATVTAISPSCAAASVMFAATRLLVRFRLCRSPLPYSFPGPAFDVVIQFHPYMQTSRRVSVHTRHRSERVLEVLTDSTKRNTFFGNSTDTPRNCV